MSNLIFSLNSTLPIFIVIIIGYVLGQKKFLTKEFCSVADKLVFRVGLPAMLFCDMTSIDLTENFNGKIRSVLFRSHRHFHHRHLDSSTYFPA